MKVKIFAVATLIITVLSVFINTWVLESKIDEISLAVESLYINEENVNESKAEAEKIYEKFSSLETYISLTVNHNDLTNIEAAFAEMIGYLSVDDADGAKVTKNRLLDALTHLRRLSGVNIDAII